MECMINHAEMIDPDLVNFWKLRIKMIWDDDASWIYDTIISRTFIKRWKLLSSVLNVNLFSFRKIKKIFHNNFRIKN